MNIESGLKVYILALFPTRTIVGTIFPDQMERVIENGGKKDFKPPLEIDSEKIGSEITAEDSYAHINDFSPTPSERVIRHFVSEY